MPIEIALYYAAIGLSLFGWLFFWITDETN